MYFMNMACATYAPIMAPALSHVDPQLLDAELMFQVEGDRHKGIEERSRDRT